MTTNDASSCGTPGGDSGERDARGGDVRRVAAIRWRWAAVTLVVATGISAWVVPRAAQVDGWGLERVLSRAVAVTVVMTLIAALGLPSRSRLRAALGPCPGRRFAIAYALSLATLAFDAWLRLEAGVQDWRADPIGGARLVRKLVTHAVGGVLLAAVEEALFRGGLWSLLAGWLGRLRGAVLGSLLFAWLHYLRVPAGASRSAHIPGTRQSVFEWLDAAGSVLERGWQGPLENPAPGVGLFLFGLILSLVVHRTRGLAAAIGVHAGVVFFLKMDGGFLRVVPEQPTWFFGSRDLVDGVLSWLLLIAVGLALAIPGRRGPDELSSR